MLAVLWGILNISVVQNYIVGVLTEYATEELGAKVEIGGVDINFFNSIELEGVKIEDQKGDSLLNVKELNVEYSFTSLFSKVLNLTEVQLVEPTIRLNADTMGVLNAQFLIDVFANSDTTPKNIIDISIDEVEIVDGDLAFVAKKYTHIKKQSLFNPHDIHLQDLNTVVSFKLWNNTNYTGRLKNLRFREQSGFELAKLNVGFLFTDTLAVIPNFELKTSNSQLTVDSIFMKYDSMDALKHNVRNTLCNLDLRPSTIYLPDFKEFLPQLNNYRDTLTLKGTIDGTLDDIAVKGLSFAYGKNLGISGDVEALGLPDMGNTFFYGNVELMFSKNSVQDVVANAMRRPMLLPKELNALGVCRYKGNITGFLSDLVLYGNLRTEVGSVRTDVQMKIPSTYDKIDLQGKLSSKGVNLGKVLPKSKLGTVSFIAKTKLKAGKNLPIENTSKIKLSSITYNAYTYKDIIIEGHYTNNEFEGILNVDDENAKVNFEGKFGVNPDEKYFNFTTKVDDLNPGQLNLIKGYDDMSIGLNLAANFSGSKWKNMDGELNIDSILIQRTGRQHLIEKIEFEAQNNAANHITIDGDLLRGDILGKYAFETLVGNFMNVVSEQMPILAKEKQRKTNQENQFSFYLKVAPLKKLCNILDLKWHTNKSILLQGQFNDITKRFYADLDIPNISNGTNNINNFNLYCDNNQSLNVSLQAATKLKKDSLYAGLTIIGKDNEILTSVKFDNKRKKNATEGELITKTSFTKNDDALETTIKFLPSTLLANGKKWDIGYSKVQTDFKRVEIDGFYANCEDQSISIDGYIGSQPTDTLAVQLNKINLDHISELLPNQDALHFGGTVTGEAYVSNALTPMPIIEADVIASNFMFNKSYFGTAHATSQFDIENACLLFNGVVTDDYNARSAVLDGKYYFVKDSLDIKGNAQDLDMRFLNYYLGGILDDVQGRATGNVHIHGFTRAKTIAVDAKAHIAEGQAGIDFLKTKYFFSDSIEINGREIKLEDITLIDEEGNKAVLDGYIKHRYFENMDYNIGIKTKNILAMNTNKINSESFYGKIYATGNVNITGNEFDGTTITCKAQTESNSKLVIPMDNYFAADNSFITFINTNLKEDDEDEEEPSMTNTNLFLDMMVDVQPSAEVLLLINSKTGDMLQARGGGSLRVSYDMNSGDMKMYGNYALTEGKYIFTFQNALRKEFKVIEGSSISWAGDPTDADINIDAAYQLNASLSDILDHSLLSNSSRTSTMVQCLLKLRGNLMQPDINFDILVPNADEEIARAVNNAINTEELVNRQTVSLLVLGKFMGLDYMNNSNINTQNEIYSVVSSTLSSMLNSWASQLFDKWNFGINYRPGQDGAIADEYEFNFLYTPNNRITINGNVGYKDDAMSTNKFIGDFDIEYKLIESGKLSLKAYTHTNDYNEFKQSYTTQGVGIVYRESFNNGKSLWNGWVEDTKSRKEKNKIKREARKKRRAEKKARKEAEKAAKQAAKLEEEQESTN